MTNEILIRIYRAMLLTRLFEARVIALQRQGKVSVYATSEGEEAIGTAAVSALAEGDWLFPDYRSAGALFARGVTIDTYLAQLLGTAHDSSKGRQMPTHYASLEQRIASVSTPVGNNIVHAAGLAWAVKIRKGPEVVLVLFGDGATSSDGFHAAMNIAGVHRLPIVFLCRNNQYAISLPLNLQTASATIAIKAQAYGFEGVRIDGNDPEAVYTAAFQASERARHGEGPTLIEAVGYRFGSHTTADDAKRYRSDGELAEWKDRDCIEATRRKLEQHGIWDKEKDNLLRRELGAQIDLSVKAALEAPAPPLSSMFSDVYAELPRHLREQLRDLTKGQT
ncbi:MAG: thiamine pyrophosphate-dependent dehydrogenase E1 component subunit alpha [Acidobacteria bacterium]|nr:thiamine pyrophosphate-dependent dehydrogenase E1 component subunit alpha [Acidobacteriota bacterium]